ncbi:hypothetical protein FNV43_RR16675 [Rhamnella rubrinervis]|uniref:RRM domain-containing protein n=1 Tax=Rhamnella rubrinervis TaxID=2594499 RepID=A0A8K0GZ84_9ROSA|nr:hypothetical protein FNV43_RR16675 [Rhamnella rubrinervis]
MAATTTASSSLLCNKISNLSITHSITPIPSSFLIPSKPPKPLTLKAQFPKFPPLSLVSFLSHFRRASAAFDGFELKEDTSSAEEHQDPEDPKEAEIYDNQDGQEEEEEEQQQQQKVSRSSVEAGRLYVGNLPYSTTSSQLAEVFGEAGSVVNVEVIYDRVTDRSRGFAFVTMGSIDEAKEAIRMFDGSQVGGRTVKVNFPEVPRGGEKEVLGPKIRNSNRGFVDSPHKIYAGNLGWSLTSQGLGDAFADQPGLLSAKVVYERNSGRSRGFGFVSFETAEAAQSALNAMNGVEVEGRPLRLNSASERAPPASSSEEGIVTEDENSSELLSNISA